MSDLLISKSLRFIKNNINCSNDEMIKIRYGLEGVYSTINKTVIIFLIGFLFHFLDIVLLTLFVFNFFRFFAFGLHAKKSIHCLILSILLFNVLPLIFMNVNINQYLIISIFVFSFCSFLLFAPSDTVKRPLTNKRKRIIRKVLSVTVLIVLYIIIQYFSFLTIPVLCASFIESIIINPISYQILGLSYSNYKTMA